MSKHAEHLRVRFASERFEGPSATELHPQTKTSSLWFFYRETTNLKSVDDLAKQCVETQSLADPAVCLWVQPYGPGVVLHACRVCVRACRLCGQSEPDLLTACAAHLVDVAHHGISGETWGAIRGGTWVGGGSRTRCSHNGRPKSNEFNNTGAYLPDLWRRRREKDLPPPPRPSSRPQRPAGRPLGLRDVRRGQEMRG